MTTRKSVNPTKRVTGHQSGGKQKTGTSDEIRQRESREAVKALRLMDEESRRRRTAFKDFVRANKHMPCVQRAEAWLRFVASDPESYGDQEALIYLASRGEECSSMIRTVVEHWQRDEERAIRSCAKGHGVSYGGKVAYRGGMSLSAARDVEHVSPFDLPNFWYRHRDQEQTIDATLLRTVETCGIGGFEKWWKRLARETTTGLIEGGAEHGPLVYWLFAMCRSDLAIRLMPKALHLALDNIEVVRHGESPWTDVVPIARIRRKANEYRYGDIDDFHHAAALVFANCRLRGKSGQNEDMLDSATGLLQKHQRRDGSWPLWSSRKKSSIETTATAVYALAYHKPNGWKRYAQAAANWLESQQTEGGYWLEPSSPDPTYLTVLVLDALELNRAGEPVTFGTGRKLDAGRDDHGSSRFRVALSFPGESRPIVEKVAEILWTRLGKSQVFYDRNFEAILARPDLDVFLQNVYRRRSDLVVVWLSADYQRKEWCCNVEWPAIRDIIKRRRADDVMFLRLDDGEVEGVLSTYGYIDVQRRSAAEVADLILQRLEQTPTATSH